MEQETERRTSPAAASHRINDLCMLNQRRDVVDLDIARVHLFNEGWLSELQVLKLVADACEILESEPTLLRIDRAAVVVGDIHGQFYDLVALLDNFDLSQDTLVFLGDYVDRGLFSTEVYFYLLLLKTHHPRNVYLLRGNHESAKTTEHFTFKEECRQKYSLGVYRRCVDSFRALPLAAVVLGRLYCAHGGISSHAATLEDIDAINRFSDTDAAMHDILWTDPHPSYDEGEHGMEFTQNFARKCSHYYTYAGVAAFLKRNNLLCIVRGHEVQQRGYRTYRPFRGIPSVVTIFSAPNYCDEYRNLGAILRFDGKSLGIKTFSAQPHPFCLPNWMDGVNWSYPFVAEKISEFYLDLLKELDVSDALMEEMEKTQSLACSMAVIRAERENLSELEDWETVSATGIGSGCGYSGFEECRAADAPNEAVPPKTQHVCITMSAAPSLAPPVAEAVGERSLGTVLRESSIVVLEDRDTMRTELQNK